MKEKHIHILSIALTAFYGAFVAWLYLVEPKSLGELPAKAQATIEKATTKTQVAIGTYEVDKAKFDEGLNFFRRDNFVAARAAFERADTERRRQNAILYRLQLLPARFRQTL